jgi:hypothetical protein
MSEASDMGPEEARMLDEARMITEGRCKLDEAVDLAFQHVNNARQYLRDLQSNSIFDIEVIEGAVGGDLAYHLENARRSLSSCSFLIEKNLPH